MGGKDPSSFRLSNQGFRGVGRNTISRRCENGTLGFKAREKKNVIIKSHNCRHCLPSCYHLPRFDQARGTGDAGKVLS